MNPRRDSQRRTEYALQVWVLEAKGIPTKRSYFCEICLDKTLFGVTSTKPRHDICFWGQHFEFSMLPRVENVCINLYREADPKKKKDRSTLIGYVNIRTEDVAARHPVERWYTVTSATDGGKSKNGSQEQPAIRVKARWQEVEILPLHAYDELLNFLMYKKNFLPLCEQLEPLLSVKAKEDVATSLVRIMHKKKLSSQFLCEVVMSEVTALDNEHLMFRGNSLATKSMEAFMKLVAGDYLNSTLSDFIKQLLESGDDCEVDPLKLSGASTPTLEKNRANLMLHVETAWGKIMNSTHRFPWELREVFFALRERLDQSGRRDLADNLVSSSIFLRFLCPAILSPSLFDLIAEYPSPKASRNLTLIAKTLQNLANFTKFGGKESYMEFMNEFVDREWEHMHDYLLKISQRVSRNNETDGLVDEGKELSLLGSYLDEVWTEEVHERVCAKERRMADLRPILNDLNECRRRSTGTLTTHSLSDYDNASIYRHRNQNVPIYSPPHNGQAVITRAQPAAHLNTSDDYVLNTALLNDSLVVRHAGLHVQQARKPRRPESYRLDGEATTSSRTSSNTACSSLSEARDDSDSDGETHAHRSRKPRRRPVVGNEMPVCDPSCSSQINPPSSGYQSHNPSSHSNSSSSSSPVERSAALAIANPAFCAPSLLHATHSSNASSYQRASPPTYGEHSAYRIQAPIYSTPTDACELSPGAHSSVSAASSSCKSSLPRTNPRTNPWQGRIQPTSPLQNGSTVQLRQPHVVARPSVVDVLIDPAENNNEWVESRLSVQGESKPWADETKSPLQRQADIIEEQRRQIERLVLENEELRRQMGGSIAAVSAPLKSNVQRKPLLADSGASEDSYSSMNSLERRRPSVPQL